MRQQYKCLSVYNIKNEENDRFCNFSRTLFAVNQSLVQPELGGGDK